MSATTKPNNNKPKRADKAEKERRIEAIIEKIAEGQGGQKLVDWICAEYELAESSAYEYYKDATNRINRSFDNAELEEHKAVMLARLNRIYAIAIKAGNLSAALKAEDQIAKVQGLESPKEVKNTHNFEGLENEPNEYLERIVASGAAAPSQGGNDSGRASSS